MAHSFQPGQQFTVLNPDHMIFEEVWTVVEVAYPTITFSCWRRWHVDKEDILPTSTDLFSGRVVREDAVGCLLIDARHTWQDFGYRVEADQVSYLDKRAFQWYLDNTSPS